jgi:hypothetical protein
VSWIFSFIRIAPVGIQVVVRKSWAIVQANEAVSHLRWNVEETMAGLFGQAHKTGKYR